MVDIRLWIITIGGLLFGLYLFFKGFIWLRHKKLIEALPTSKIRSIAMGLVEIFGEAIPSKGNTLNSPFSNKQCVYYKYTIEEYRKSGKSSKWVTVKSGEDKRHFFVKDDTGTVLIDPKGADISIPIDFEFNSSFGKDPNDNIKEFLKKNNMNFEGFFGMNKTMRYREYFIAPKDRLYVIGTASDNPYVEEASVAKGHEDIMIGKVGKEFFYVSDRPEKDILKSFRWKVAGGLFGGGLLIFGSVSLIIFYLGLF